MTRQKSEAPPEPLRDYAVGYGRPPQHTRFRKGRSGNPNGRTPRARDLAARLVEALGEPVAARADRASGKTNRDAIVEGLVAQAVAGDLAATKLLFDIVRRSELALAVAEIEDPREALLRELARLAASRNGDTPAEGGGDTE